MEPTSEATPSHLTLPANTPKLSRIGLSLIMTAILCGFTVSGLSSYSDAQAQSPASEAGADHPGWVQSPGQLIRPDCVHEIPKGAMVELTNDGQISGDVTLDGVLVAHYDPCSENAVITGPRGPIENLTSPPGTGNGWVEASALNVALSPSDNIDFMAGNWVVPSNPSVNGALLYLFNGIEPASGNWILQPVLQYGAGAAGGGNYWTIASWLVGAHIAFHSPLEKVHPGNSIFGYTVMTGASGSTRYWKVQARDTTTGASSWLTAHDSGNHWTWAFAAVLEAHNLRSCSEFPSNGHVAFKNSVAAHGFPAYKAIPSGAWFGALFSYGGPSCGFSVFPGKTSTLYW
jgi:hypothetical protein